MRYNPALDGLRAIAITLVVLAHAFNHTFSGGWIGVDVFFVLSGYLITSILTAELHETGAINMGNFYIRRTLRLTPAILLLASFQFVHSAFSPHNGPEIRGHLDWIVLPRELEYGFQLGPNRIHGSYVVPRDRGAILLDLAAHSALYRQAPPDALDWRGGNGAALRPCVPLDGRR
jgi:peptidoglycan/LPS O-acetylase OafA/YrhL